MAQDWHNVTGAVDNTYNFLSFTQNVDTQLLPEFNLGAIIIFMVFTVLFLSMLFRQVPVKNAAASSVFICMFLAVMMRAMSLLSDMWWYVFLIMGPITLGFLIAFDR